MSKNERMAHMEDQMQQQRKQVSSLEEQICKLQCDLRYSEDVRKEYIQLIRQSKGETRSFALEQYLQQQRAENRERRQRELEKQREPPPAAAAPAAAPTSTTTTTTIEYAKPSLQTLFAIKEAMASLTCSYESSMAALRKAYDEEERRLLEYKTEQERLQRLRQEQEQGQRAESVGGTESVKEAPLTGRKSPYIYYFASGRQERDPNEQSVTSQLLTAEELREQQARYSARGAPSVNSAAEPGRATALDDTQGSHNGIAQPNRAMQAVAAFRNRGGTADGNRPGTNASTRQGGPAAAINLPNLERRRSSSRVVPLGTKPTDGAVKHLIQSIQADRMHADLMDRTLLSLSKVDLLDMWRELGGSAGWRALITPEELTLLLSSNTTREYFLPIDGVTVPIGFFEHVLSRLPKLEVCGLKGMDCPIDLATLDSINKPFPLLTKLDLSRSHMTDANLLQLPRRFMKLVKLDVSSCPDISYEGIQAVSRAVNLSGEPIRITSTCHAPNAKAMIVDGAPPSNESSIGSIEKFQELDALRGTYGSYLNMGADGLVSLWYKLGGTKEWYMNLSPQELTTLLSEDYTSSVDLRVNDNHLQTLHYTSIRANEVEGFCSQVLPRLTELRNLQIVDCPVFPFNWPVIQRHRVRFPRLLQILLRRTPCADDELLELLCRVPSLGKSESIFVDVDKVRYGMMDERTLIQQCCGKLVLMRDRTPNDSTFTSQQMQLSQKSADMRRAR